MNYRTFLLFALCFHLTVISAMNEMERKKLIQKPDACQEQSWLFNSPAVALHCQDITLPDLNPQKKPFLCADIHSGNGMLAVGFEYESSHDPYFFNPTTMKHFHNAIPAKKAIVTSLAFSPQGYLLALGKRVALDQSQVTLCSNIQVNNGIPQWDIAPNNPFPQVPSFFHALKFNAGALTLATASNDGTVRLWDIEKSSCTRIIQEKNAIPAYALAYLDTHLLCFSNTKKGITLYDPRSPSVVVRTELHNGLVRALSASIARRMIVSGADDGSVVFSDMRFYPLVDYGAIASYSPVKTPITSIAIHQQYDACVVGSADGIVSFCNTKGKHFALHRAKCHQGRVAAVALTGGRDHSALSLGNDGILKLLCSIKEQKAAEKLKDAL